MVSTRPNRRPLWWRRGELRIQITNPEETAAFLEYVERRNDVVVTRVYPALAPATGETTPDELELAVVGSLNEEGMRMEITLLLRAWAAARRGEGKDVSVELLERTR